MNANNQVDVCVIFYLFILMLIGGCVGIVIGVSISDILHQNDICKCMSVTVEDYMTCNTSKWEDIIKQIPKGGKNE